ncbi:MAG: adenylate kinase [Actinobacteria bacterium]|nr:adenylate kinase [Actinomycetota bacterium]
MPTGVEVGRLRKARRILVVGPSGAGKTKLALGLGETLGLPLVHLDSHRWRAGWVALPHAAWRSAVAELVRKPAWIMDGTYESTLDLRVPAADTIVVLERPRLLCVTGVLRRRLLTRKPRPDAPPGQPLDRAFFRYLWRYPIETRPLLDAALREHGKGKAVIVLRGRRRAQRLVRELRAAAASSRQVARAAGAESGGGSGRRR